MEKKANRKLLKTLILNILFLIIGLAVGLYFGWTQMGKPSRSMERLFAVTGYLQYASMMYQNAEYKEAKEALLQLISLMDELKNAKGIDYFDIKMYQVDILATYARLAILEERFEHANESTKYMNEAIKRCQAIGWRDCSSKRIRELIDKTDRNFIDTSSAIDKQRSSRRKEM